MIIEIGQEDNKLAEIILKGINILISSYKNSEMSNELKELIEKNVTGNQTYVA